MTDTTTTDTTTTTTTVVPPWFDGADTETVGYLQNRGWDKVDAKTAAMGAIKAHREAEKLIGAPADRLVRLPKDATDQAAWNEFRQKVGVPADVKGYDFSSVKFGDGTALDDNFTAAISAALLDANVSKDRAPGVAQAVVKFMEQAETTEAGEAAAKLALEKDTLNANWGAHKNANMIIAQNAAKTLGLAPEAIAALENQVGYAAVMEMMRNIGVRIGEAKFIASGAPGSEGGPMTVEQAKATLAERKADRVWVDKFMNGDVAAKREFDNLTRMMQG